METFCSDGGKLTVGARAYDYPCDLPSFNRPLLKDGKPSGMRFHFCTGQIIQILFHRPILCPSFLASDLPGVDTTYSCGSSFYLSRQLPLSSSSIDERENDSN